MNQDEVVGRSSDQFNLRMPQGLRPQVKVLAAQNRRSMNSELVFLLEQGIKAIKIAEQNAQ